MIKVAGAGCLSGLGASWRGISDRLAAPAPAEVALAGIPADHPRAERLAERLMSRSAVLGHLATRQALAEAGWAGGDVAGVGFFMGVGASGGSAQQLEAMLAASRGDEGFSLERFGDAGLRACNPLFAFQLMNNFAMCHAAILAGTRGPNAALFSRGGGTAWALARAVAALDDDGERCLCGGADTAVDPVTFAELCRGGFVAEGLRPAEGAAVLALSRRPGDPALATVAHAGVAPADAIGIRAAAARALASAGAGLEAVVVCGWGPARCLALSELASEVAGGADVLDATAALGESLAATPALGWAVALDRIQNGADRVAVLSAGIDGDVGAAVFERPGRTSRAPRRPARGKPEPVITGVGVVSAFGRGAAALWDGLAAGASAVRPIRAFDAATFPTRVAAEVPPEVFAALEPPADLPGGAWRDRKLRFALDAAAEAWAAAGLGPDAAGEAHLSLAVGLEQAFLEDFDASFDGARVDWELERRLRSPATRTRSPVDLITAWVRRALGLGGPATTHVSACAAGALAIADAASRIRSGRAEAVVCGGADSMINPLGIGGMARLGAPSPRAEADACRPFDRRRDGLVMGEGAALFVVESRARAEARGVRPLAAVLGWGSTQDGYKATAPRPDGSAAAAAMSAALRRAGLAPGAVGYINAHGTGTPLNDPAEAAAIRQVFPEPPPVSSIKGAVGHLMAAAGAMELAACLVAFARDLLPGTAHHRERAPECDLDVIGPQPRPARIDALLSNSFGFGGQNASVILGRCA